MAESNHQESLQWRIASLEKQLREKDNSFKKENALLSQKIELLNIQLKDSQEREENTRRMHSTMLSAFKDNKQESSKFGDPNIDKLIKEYENKVKYLTERNRKLEESIKEIKSVYESNQSDMKNSPINNCWIEHDAVINNLKEEIDKIKKENIELSELSRNHRNCWPEGKITEINNCCEKQIKDMEIKFKELKGKLPKISLKIGF